jgi:hemerythrin-like domain-containing protein
MNASTSLDLLHAGPAAGFDQPFELLAACHGRVERMLGLLERLAAHLAAHGADEPARSAAADITRYFDIAGPAHHEDEERHVLPRLRASGDPALAALADRLHADHARMARDWAALRAELAQVREGRWADAADAGAALPAAWADFAAFYRHHIAAEDDQAYPAVRATLDDDSLRRMGREMAARRGARETS